MKVILGPFEVFGEGRVLGHLANVFPVFVLRESHDGEYSEKIN